MEKGLTIYKASAGSGKTYQLTADYLKMVFKPGNHFRNILAVTFTNKATGEMRERILKALYQLSLGEKQDYAEMLHREYGFSSEQIKSKAEIILNSILYQYSYFNVSTIDSFFQTIIKSFAREMGLSHGFNLELDMQGTIEKAIAQMFENFKQDSNVTGWLTKYAFEKMQEGKTWDVEQSLLKFASSTFSEVFYSFDIETLEKISDISRFEDYKKELSKIINEFINRIHRIATEAKQMMASAGLVPEDFTYGKSGPAGFILKHLDINPDDIDLPGTRAIKAADSADAWTSKNSPKKTDIIACAEAGLMKKMDELVTLLNQDNTTFYTAVSIRKNINAYALSARVYKQLIDYCNEQDIFLLGLATPFLSKMIGNDDAPFIYEKTGNYIHHFMIDEFQDTSVLNWQNFTPLLSNSLAQGWPSLVVGDVKQAIYRWRNGNWALLDHQVERQLKGFGVNTIDLPNNYRSQKQIIFFNNWSFEAIFRQLHADISTEVTDGHLSASHLEMFERTFGKAIQKVPEQKMTTEGFVSLQFIEDSESEDYDGEVAKQIIEEIDRLAGLGYQPGDMAILVRRNSEGARMAGKLMEARIQFPEKASRYQFVSNDSIFLGRSSAIQLIVVALKYILNPNDKHTRGSLIWHYFNRTKGQQVAVEKLQALAFVDEQAILKELPAEFEMLIQQSKYLSITNVAYRLIDVFIYQSATALDPGEIPYLNSFEDEVFKFNQTEGSNLQRFIEWWDEKGNTTVVATNENQNAIRIMTIHKAKGLQFNVVFLPYADWTLGRKPDPIWCIPQQAPFDAISPVPVNYEQKLARTIFKNEYFNEKFMALTDNLNVLYVALTRAVNAMYIFAPHKTKSKNDDAGLKNTAELLYKVAMDFKPSLDEKTILKLKYDETNHRFTAGTLNTVVSEVKKTETFGTVPQRPLNPIKNPIKIRQHAAPFFTDLDLETPIKINQGALLHHVFEHVFYIEDIAQAVDKVIRKGLIGINEKDDWINRIKGMLNQPGVSDWFDHKWEVHTEQSILLANGEVKRPDRILISDAEIVVIDYKFVRKTNEDHANQVKEYMEAIREMADKPVKGFVWYAFLGDVIAISL